MISISGPLELLQLNIILMILSSLLHQVKQLNLLSTSQEKLALSVPNLDLKPYLTLIMTLTTATCGTS